MDEYDDAYFDAIDDYQEFMGPDWDDCEQQWLASAWETGEAW